MNSRFSISALFRAIGITFLVIALPLVSSASFPVSLCAGTGEMHEAQGDSCCPEADTTGSATSHGAGCGSGADDRCACPSGLDALTIQGLSGAPPSLSGKKIADAVRIPETGSPSEVFRPPLP